MSMQWMSRRRFTLTCFEVAHSFRAECHTFPINPSRKITLDNETVRNILLALPVLLFSVVAHEYAHGYAALKQGDATAYQLGRLTWNPAKHIDPFLTILMPLMLGIASGGRLILGGAKPVPVNPRNYRNYKRGDIIVSLAGVAVNLVIALACTLLIAILGMLGDWMPGGVRTLAILQEMMISGVIINLGLIGFNLLPIPPLDGSHVFKYLLPPAWALRYQQIGSYGMLLLILVLVVGRPLLNIWMAPVYGLAQILLGSVNGFILPSPWAF
ncbi:MAG: site-2 protease family protein [Gemmatimonadota bacterium]|nr:site-2 protease family protein [Gemmatimonadota bacterium]